jgi:hypothetical protein
MRTVRNVAFIFTFVTAIIVSRVPLGAESEYDDWVSYWTEVCDGGLGAQWVGLEFNGECYCDSSECEETRDFSFCDTAHDATDSWCDDNYAGPLPEEFGCNGDSAWNTCRAIGD